MKKRFATSIRTRLLITYIGIIVLGFFGLTLLAGSQITGAVRADFEGNLQDKVRLVAHGISSSIRIVNLSTNGNITRINASTLDITLKQYETEIGSTIVLYPVLNGDSGPASGRDAGPPPPPLRDDNPRSPLFDMPELETAQRGETIVVQRKNAIGADTFYTASAISYNRQLIAIVQLAVPTQSLQSVVFQRWVELIVVFALLTSIALLAALLLSRSIIQPLYKLRESAVQLSKGDL